MAAFPGGFVLGPPGDALGWGEWAFQGKAGTFNALHMSVIPKGPYRGRVMVMNRYPVFIQPGPSHSATDYWYCQAWSIVDPSPNPVGPRFRNYLLPLGTVGATPPPFGGPIEVSSLFCSGHAWSPHGDLVIAGGDTFLWDPANPQILIQELGAKWVFVWDPAASSSLESPFRNIPTLYGSDFGRWRHPSGVDGDLEVNRWYPTVTMTHRLPRTSPDETMVISGGSDPFAVSVPPNPAGVDPRNTYEAFRVGPNGTSQFLQRDTHLGQKVFRGPGVTAVPHSDWLDEYPRLHLLSDGMLFQSGYAPNASRLNHNSPPITTSGWDVSIGRTGFSFPHQRHDGCSVHFARLGPFQDLIVRLCGSDGLPSHATSQTDTAEYCFASTPGAGWNPLPNVPGGPRVHANAVVLPDASILVIGGAFWEPSPSMVSGPHMNYSRYTLAAGWSRPLPIPSARGYHSTAVLLPDGRVLVGGGEGRHAYPSPIADAPADYDIYEPPYLHSGAPRPTSVQLPGQVLTGSPDPHYVLGVQQAGIQLTCQISGLGSLDRIVLTSPGSTTHHSDMSARYIELVSTAVTTTSRTFSLPAETVVPRGYYMLWAVSAGGVPSEAIWIRVV